MNDLEPTAISLVGLGHMGAPMAARWLTAGREVHGFDLAEAARAALDRKGGVPHDSVISAVEATAVCVLMLPDSEVVDGVLDGLLAEGALGPGRLVIDMSSSEPMRSIENGRRIAEAGATFIDAPVSGGVRGVVAGTLAIMAGGHGADVDRARPILEDLGTVTHVGSVGAGHAAKALNNLVSATHLWMTSEAVLIAERMGIDRTTMIEVLNASTGRSVSSEVKWPRFILPGDFSSGFSARLLSKDIGIATDLMSRIGLPEFLGGTVAELWRRVSSDLGPNADHTEVARWIEHRYAAVGEEA